MRETRAAFEDFVKLLGDSAAAVDLPEAYAAAWDDQRAIMAADMAHNLGAVVERGGDASSKQLRDFLAEGRQVSAVRYLAARDAARRYAAGIDRNLQAVRRHPDAGDPRRRAQGHGHRQPGVLLAVVADRPAGVVAAAVERGGRHAARRATRRPQPAMTRGCCARRIG